MASLAPPRRFPPHINEGWFWLHWADQDYVAARILYLARNPQLWMPAALTAHKALEEYLKAFLRTWGDTTNWRRQGHDLVFLAQKATFYDSSFGNAYLPYCLKTFYDYYLTWEYPDSSGSSQPLGANDLESLDTAVAHIRPKIKFEVFYQGLPNAPNTFEAFHSGGLPDRQNLLRWARKKNNWFSKM